MRTKTEKYLGEAYRPLNARYNQSWTARKHAKRQIQDNAGTETLVSVRIE